MARIDWVRHKLENWARWCSESASGGLGYPMQSAFSRLGVSGCREDGWIPMMPLDAAETNQAVDSLKLTQPHLHMVLTLVFAKGLPRHLAAKKMGRAESTIKRNLEDAEYAIARWFSERQRATERLE
jgi:predicted DNA-binding protein (UPF0251 family)